MRNRRLDGQSYAGALIVVFEAELGDETLAHDVAEGILELHRLDKKVVLRIEPGSSLRRLEIEAPASSCVWRSSAGVAGSISSHISDAADIPFGHPPTTSAGLIIEYTIRRLRHSVVFIGEDELCCTIRLSVTVPLLLFQTQHREPVSAINVGQSQSSLPSVPVTTFTSDSQQCHLQGTGFFIRHAYSSYFWL